MYEAIIFSAAGPIATIKLNRPEKLNAFGGPMRDEILHALDKAAADDQIRVLVVTGEGRGFSAGGDIHHLKQLRENRDQDGFRSILAKGQQITRAMRSLPKPVIAAVNGPCAGAGFSFALGCDIRIASDLEDAFAREIEVQTECFHSEDFLEGVTAFTEKRKPRFKGR